MLKLTKIALLGAVAAAGMASTAANAATVQGTAEVDIISAVTLVETTGMDLGIVASSTTAGTVVLGDDASSRSCTGGVTCVGTTGFSRGVFTVGGAPAGYTVAYSVDAAATLNRVGGGGSMSLALNPSGTATSAGTFTVAAGATATDFYVGGTLSVGASQAAGQYTGTYNVTANYN